MLSVVFHNRYLEGEYMAPSLIIYAYTSSINSLLAAK